MEPITAGFKHVLTYFKLAGESQGILALQGFITACVRQGTRQAQVPYKPYLPVKFRSFDKDRIITCIAQQWLLT